MEIQFRTFRKTDTADLLLLMAELGYTVEREEFLKTIGELQKRDGAIFVAVISGKIVGSSSVIIDVRLAEGISGEIASLVVSEEFRGLGIGGSLIELAEEYLSKKVNAIRIRANVIRSKAHNYYKSLGYEEVKEQKVFVKPLQE